MPHTTLVGCRARLKSETPTESVSSVGISVHGQP